MAKYGSSSVAIYVASSGGTTYNVTSYVDTIGGQKITSITEPTHTFGDSWEEATPVGLSRGEPFDIEGHYDDTATSGPHALFSAVDRGTTDSTRSVIVGLGGSKFFSMTARLTGYETIATNGKLTRYRASFLPTGTVAWTTSTSGVPA